MFRSVCFIALLFSVIFISTSCESQDSSVLKFGVEQKLKMDKGERPVVLNKDHLNFFNKYCRNDSINFILNKVIQANDHSVYISLGFSNAIQEVYQNMEKDTTLFIYEKKFFKYNNITDYFRSYFFKKDNQFFFRTVYAELKYDEIVLLDYTSKDSVLVSKMFTNDNYWQIKLAGSPRGN